eukprot:CAMPEP_0181189200 /NCGR_PEP_ID=MMETSP1096-20121128/11536_1 /TAXON_ID=156174 ORGANISM="Chrysochromulina ericina, Strain CCMP281" /NCGR_SAMPLE_ID=MMETSP1096 /ASSEMBLY_ACC=CAM_ASM_000453 /LENGTH=285 /DNA_ID=CAMNT_0023278339 /DNA_START=179 /DNA_END=1037 /DNA_ORIENTATION=-
MESCQPITESNVSLSDDSHNACGLETQHLQALISAGRRGLDSTALGSREGAFSDNRPAALSAGVVQEAMGVHYAFSDAAGMAHDYAIALDVDTIFQSRRDFSGHFRRWSDRKALITADSILWEAERHWSTWQQGVTTRACRRVGLNASLLGQPTPVLWWNDAPIYERAGFDAFFARVDWTQLSAAKPWWVAGFEHASYACYKALEERWDQLRVHRPLERASSDEQQCASTVYNYSFLWSRNMNEYRLLLIHGDRPRFHQVEAGITSICGEPFAWDGPIHMNRLDT